MRVKTVIKVNMGTIREAGEKKSEKVACHKMKCVDQLLHLSGPPLDPTPQGRILREKDSLRSPEETLNIQTEICGNSGEAVFEYFFLTIFTS